MLLLFGFGERMNAVKGHFEGLMIVHAGKTCNTLDEILSSLEAILHCSKVDIGMDALVLL